MNKEVIFMFLLLEPILVQSCHWTSTEFTVSGTSGQSATPAPPAPVTSTCGHSKYYSTTNIPGAGIVGGVIAQQNQYPWIARLSIQTVYGVYLCGGTIISNAYILTAAHCISGYTIYSITANLGDHNARATDTGEKLVTISSWTKHPLYSDSDNDYDFALLRLSQTLTFTSWEIQPICLPSSCDTGCTTAGSVVYIAGWGTTSSDSDLASQYLRSAYVQIGDWNVCRSQHDDYLTDRMICAGYLSGGIDTCQGDSGGPLMSNEDGFYKLCGLTSWGYDCAQPNSYGVYSKVCSQLTWIKTTAGIP